MLRKIYKFIDEYILENDLLQMIGGSILWILSFCIFLFVLIDSTPATNEDYAQLINQQQEITKNFNTVYSYDNYQISPAKDNIKVILSNKECKLICQFDKNLKYLNHEKSDSYTPKIVAILESIILGLMFAYIMTAILLIAIPFVISLLLKLLHKICRLLI